MSITHPFSEGDCITSASPGDVCGLNSVATECSNLTATMCSCNEGYESEDGLICNGMCVCQWKQEKLKATIIVRAAIKLCLHFSYTD